MYEIEIEIYHKGGRLRRTSKVRFSSASPRSSSTTSTGSTSMDQRSGSREMLRVGQPKKNKRKSRFRQSVVPMFPKRRSRPPSLQSFSLPKIATLLKKNLLNGIRSQLSQPRHLRHLMKGCALPPM